MRYPVNKAARLLINHCIKHQIGTIVFRWNQGQRQEVNLGKQTKVYIGDKRLCYGASKINQM